LLKFNTPQNIIIIKAWYTLHCVERAIKPLSANIEWHELHVVCKNLFHTPEWFALCRCWL